MADSARRMLVCALLAGCDGVFGLQHLPERGDAPIGDGMLDSRCPAPTGTTLTKVFGARSGGLLSLEAADTFVSDDSAHVQNNFGALDTIFVCSQCLCSTACYGISGDDDDVIGLLRFDLGTEVPPCSVVTSARLFLHTTGDELGSGSVAVYTVLEAWDEGIGALTTGAPGAANWTQRKPGLAWLTPGVGAPGSRNGPSIAESPASTGETDYPITLDPKPVQIWVADPARNHGLALSVTGSTSDVHFYSREAGIASKRPALEVTYQAP